MTEMTRRKRQDQRQGECIRRPMQTMMTTGTDNKEETKEKRKIGRLCLMNERTGRRRWKEVERGREQETMSDVLAGQMDSN